MVVGTISIYTKLKNNYIIMNILKNRNKTKKIKYVPLHKRMYQSILYTKSKECIFIENGGY